MDLGNVMFDRNFEKFQKSILVLYITLMTYRMILNPTTTILKIQNIYFGLI
jgi:hypothetical protein